MNTSGPPSVWGKGVAFGEELVGEHLKPKEKEDRWTRNLGEI